MTTLSPMALPRQISSDFDNIAVSPTTAPVIDDPVNAAPEFVEGATAVRYVEEDGDSDRPNRVPETIGGPVMAMDEDNPALDYTLSGTDAASFRITAGTGQLMTSAPLNYENNKKSYTVVVTANDGSGGTDEITVTIEVKDLDEKPTLMAEAPAAPAPANNAPEFPATEDGARSVAENTAAGRNIGAPVAAIDADTGDTLAYTLGGADMASFAINRATGQLMTRAALDHERKPRYTVTVTASDGTDDAMVTVIITVTDVVDEAPTNNAPEFPATEDGARSVAENTAAGENIGAPVTATDADTGDTLTYTLGGTDMAYFDIDLSSGQLMTKAALDYEMKASYTVTVTASDGNTADDATITVTITVTNVGLDDSYDANDDGMIDADEVLNAVEDYFDDVSGIGSERVLDIVELYFSS